MSPQVNQFSNFMGTCSVEKLPILTDLRCCLRTRLNIYYMGREIWGLLILVVVWGGGLFIIFIMNYVLFSIKTYLCGYLSLLSRLVGKKKKWKNRAKALQNIAFYSAGLWWRGIFPHDSLGYRVNGIFLALIPIWLSKLNEITEGCD